MNYSGPTDWVAQREEFAIQLRFLRERLSESQNHRCCYCGQIFIEGHPLRKMTIEHIRSKGSNGSNDYENLAAACHWCNNLRGNRSLKSVIFLLTNKLWPIHVYGNNKAAKGFLKFVSGFEYAGKVPENLPKKGWRF